MSSQNVATTLVYMAYNTSTGTYVTGDVANHTLRLVKDGTEAAPTNSPAEVDSANAPGAYKLALTAAETQFGTVWLGGKSSTANVIIVPITATFELLPTALDANGMVKADVEDWKGAAVSAPATAGIPDINVKNFNNIGAVSLPTNFNILAIDISGNVTSTLASNIKKNSAQNGFMFVMTNPNSVPANSPMSGLTVSGSVSIDGSVFQNLTNTVVEIGQGAYKVNLAAADTNGNHLLFMFTAASANTLFLELITQP